MPLSTYGILKGTVIGHLRDADDDHYQIQVKAGNTVHRIASNVKSSAPKAPSTVLFQSTTALPDQFMKDLQALVPGYRKLASKPGGLAIDGDLAAITLDSNRIHVYADGHIVTPTTG